MTFRSTVLVFGVCLVLLLPAQAHNNYFLPGDACFSFTISKAFLSEWMASEDSSAIVDYVRLDDQFMACGNMGYSKLELTGVTGKFRQSLAEAALRFKTWQPPRFEEVDDATGELVQTNSIVALVYNQGFDGWLGLKYNEDWIKEGKGIYSGFINTKHAVVEDWKNGSRFKALRIADKIDPSAHLRNGGAVHFAISEPLQVNASSIKIVLVGVVEWANYGTRQYCRGLEQINGWEGEKGTFYSEIKEEGFSEFEQDDEGQWHETRSTVPMSPSASRLPVEVRKRLSQEGKNGAIAP